MPSAHFHSLAASQAPADAPALLTPASSPSSLTNANSRLVGESRARLDTLLSADIVELSNVCDEIRSLPQLETIIVKLATPSAALPDGPIATLEEATILLGTHQLRNFLQSWWLAQRE